MLGQRETARHVVLLSLSFIRKVLYIKNPVLVHFPDFSLQFMAMF